MEEVIPNVLVMTINRNGLKLPNLQSKSKHNTGLEN